jgi:hypothetical protein
MASVAFPEAARATIAVAAGEPTARRRDRDGVGTFAKLVAIGFWGTLATLVVRRPLHQGSRFSPCCRCSACRISCSASSLSPVTATWRDRLRLAPLSRTADRRGLRARRVGADRVMRRILPHLLLAAPIVLVPWTVYLRRVLPSHHDSAHWNVAWVGFDVGLACVLALVGVAALRRLSWLERAATAAASLLLVDAWFDVLTAHSSGERTTALLEASLVEIPLALVCLALARTEDAAVRPFVRSSGLRRPEVRSAQSIARR